MIIEIFVLEPDNASASGGINIDLVAFGLTQFRILEEKAPLAEHVRTPHNSVLHELSSLEIHPVIACETLDIHDQPGSRTGGLLYHFGRKVRERISGQGQDMSEPACIHVKDRELMDCASL